MIRDAINRLVENARLLKTFSQNHPIAVNLASYVHADETPTIVFLGRDVDKVIESLGAQGWLPRKPFRDIAATDIFRFVDGVLLIIRDAQMPAIPAGLNPSPCHS